jgi:hypothetical protein
LGLERLIVLTEDREIEQMWSSNHISRWNLTTIFQDIKNIQQQHQIRLSIKAIPLPILKDIKSMALTASRTFTDVYHINPLFTHPGDR